MIRTIQKKSCARAWADACESIISTEDEGYNVVIDVADPVKHDAKDNEAITLVDKFLKRHDQNPVVTVANTIFPQSLYEAHGAPAFYGVYHRDFDKFSRESKNWGQYFDRMTRHQSVGGEEIHPLQDMIAKLKGNEERGTRYKATYELTIYNPSSDRKRTYGGPCLSYLSFKRHPKLGLLLTAVYRNHYYVSRLLGNLIGLGWLQAFVAKEAGGMEVGSLTVVSTHAEMDTDGGWGIIEARDLVTQAAALLRE
jgi:thymidylate synthase